MPNNISFILVIVYGIMLQLLIENGETTHEQNTMVQLAELCNTHNSTGHLLSNSSLSEISQFKTQNACVILSYETNVIRCITREMWENIRRLQDDICSEYISIIKSKDHCTKK